MTAGSAISPGVAPPHADRFALATVIEHTFLPAVLGPRSVVLDLGGSSAGFAQAVYAMCGCACHVVEAAPQKFAAIAETPSIRKYHYAVCGADGPVTFAVATDATQCDSIAPVGGSATRRTVTVPGISLPTLVERLGLSAIDLLKVDIEGAEIAMFDATPDDLLRRIGQITVEFHDFEDPGQAPAVRRILSRLAGIGFAVVVMTHRFHGDVLLLNRERLGITAAQLLYFRSAVKYGRGVGRILARIAGRPE